MRWLSIAIVVLLSASTIPAGSAGEGHGSDVHWNGYVLERTSIPNHVLIDQNFNYYFTLNEKNIFAFEAQHLLRNEDPFYNANLENNENFEPTATGLGLDDSFSNFNISQNRKVKSNQLDAKIDYWNILNLKSDLNITIGTIYSKQDFRSEIFQSLLDNNDQSYPTPLINNGHDSNDINYIFDDLYLGLRYRLKVGKFTISPGFSLM